MCMKISYRPKQGLRSPKAQLAHGCEPLVWGLLLRAEESPERAALLLTAKTSLQTNNRVLIN